MFFKKNITIPNENRYQNAKKLLLIVLILLVVLVGIMTFTKIETITISGNRHYTKEEICEIIGIKERSNIFNIYFNFGNNYKNYSYIDDIDIEYISFNNIHITVDEKNIIGYILYMGKYLCLDEDAYIIDYTDKKDNGIPIIEGIKIENFVLNEKVQIEQEIIDAIITIDSIINQYEMKLDKIDFNYNLQNKILLYYKDIEINIGNTYQIYEKIQIIYEILSTLPPDSKGTLDVRDINKKIVFKKK